MPDLSERADDLLDRFIAFSKTREGIVTNGLAAIFALFLGAAIATDAQGGTTVGGIVTGLLIGVPGGWGLSFAAVLFARNRWEERTAPEVPRFARRIAASSGTPTLRQDQNAHFWQDHGGFLWSKRVWFTGTGCPPVRLDPTEYAGMSANHEIGKFPTPVVTSGGRAWWWWQDAFYWDTGDYSAADVKALLFKRERRKARELQHAHTMLAIEETPQPRQREPIPEDVKRLVFRRDGGRCQLCGSRELLQFDHVIPFSMGGSNEPQNLQLLCAPCNREKSGTL
jgi:hypothetical protein